MNTNLLASAAAFALCVLGCSGEVWGQACALGSVPIAGKLCSISDYTVGGPVKDTDAVAACQQPGGCNATSPTITYTQVPASALAAYISSKIPVPLWLTDHQTSAVNTTGATISGATSGSVSADQILAYSFCTAPCLPLPASGAGNYDGVRGIGISNPGTTVPIVSGVSGYVISNQVFSGSGPSSVALFGTGVAAVDNSEVWGINTNVSDHQYRVAQPAGTHNRRVTGAEFDVSASYTDTNVTGILIAGNAVVQPTQASAVAVVGMDFSAPVPGSIAKWQNAFYTYPGVAVHALFASQSTASTVNSDSQDLQFGAYVASTGFIGQLYFGTATMPNYGSTTQPSFNMNYPLQTKNGGLTARSTTDEVIQLGGHLTGAGNYTSGTTITSRDDSGTVLKPLELLGSQILLNTPTLQVNVSGTPTTGAICSGTPTASFATFNGIVTHC